MEGLTKEEAFFLNEEIDRMDTTVFDCLAEDDEPLDELTLDDAELEDDF
jgi:hypothetical protein